MQDVLSKIAQMNRPRLLVRAARIGAREYRRSDHLPRLLGTDHVPRGAEALLRLSEIEEELNLRRLSEDADYSINRHIDVLIAMVSEASMLRAASDRRKLM